MKNTKTYGKIFLLVMGEKGDFMCLTVVVGRQATVDGSVLVGHNEENEGPYFVNFRRVHAEQMAGAEFRHRRAAWPRELQQPTYGFLWCQIPGREYSDNYLNEAGVVIVSNGCPSREDDHETLQERQEIRQEGIGGFLRRLVAEQAPSASAAVEYIGRWVEQWGYRDSGRTYVVADPQEAWVVAVVRGRRWLAQRVPDDAAVVVPNVFIFDQIPAAPLTELGEKEVLGGVCAQASSAASALPAENDGPPARPVRCSPDLISYAIHRGWYSPTSGQPFSFRQAYQSEQRNQPDPRQWWGQQLLLQDGSSASGKVDFEAFPAQSCSIPAVLPWYVRPQRKLSVPDVAALLRNQQGPRSLFHPATQETAVFQLRAALPRPIGCVYWRTVGRPDTSPLLPWYLGVMEVPAEYCHPAFRHHLENWSAAEPLAEEIFQPDPNLIWWKFRTLQEAVQTQGEKALQKIGSVWAEMDQRLWAQQPEWEERFLSDWLVAPEAACHRMTAYCLQQSEAARLEAERLGKLWAVPDAG